MKTYKYELHAHTKEGSKCSVLPAKEMVHFYKEKGYDGIFITDHFTGNTTISKDTPWKERILEFYRNGYEIAKEEGDKIGLKVFFAPEYSINCNDFLFLGLSKQWYLEHELFDLKPNERFDLVHQGGGYIIHAHPFAEAPWIESIRLFPRKVDAVEVFNGGANEQMNRAAIWYAKEYGLRMTAGSDTHSTDIENLCGIEVDHECFTEQDIINAIKDGSAKPFSTLHNYLLYEKKGD